MRKSPDPLRDGSGSARLASYRIRQNVRGGNFRGFSLNRECFPTNYGLVDWQCKATSMLP